jgi:hypothetical protein
MKNIEIDLAHPFEKVLATVLSLPAGCSNAVTDRLSNEAELKQVIRGLYEAANGRHVETNIGLIKIAPPVYAFLKAKPFSVTTQTDLLIEAATRLITGPAIADGRRAAAGRVDQNERGAPPRRAHAPEANDSGDGSVRRRLVQPTRIPLATHETSIL